MTKGQSQASVRHRRARDRAQGPGRQEFGIQARQRARLALAALLIVLVIAGVRAADPPVRWHRPLHFDGRLVGVALEVALAALLIALRRRRGRAAQAGYAAATLNGMLTAAVGAGLIAIPVAVALDSIRPGHRRPIRSPPATGPTARSRPTGQHRAPVPLSHLDVAIIESLLLALLLAAVAGCALVIWRWRPSRAAGFDAEPEDDAAARLGRAVESGRIALRDVDEARAAIIACYVAMEQSLATAGTVRAVAETPDELLARAVAGGLAGAEPAGRLTGLFYEARFSSRPLPPTHKAAAQLALAELSADIMVPAGVAEPGAGSDGQPDAPQPGAGADGQPDAPRSGAGQAGA
jgi:hypothetical protein